MEAEWRRSLEGESEPVQYLESLAGPMDVVAVIYDQYGKLHYVDPGEVTILSSLPRPRPHPEDPNLKEIRIQCAQFIKVGEREFTCVLNVLHLGKHSWSASYWQAKYDLDRKAKL